MAGRVMAELIPLGVAQVLLGIGLFALALCVGGAIVLAVDKRHPDLIDRIADKLFGPHHS